MDHMMTGMHAGGLQDGFGCFVAAPETGNGLSGGQQSLQASAAEADGESFAPESKSEKTELFHRLLLRTRLDVEQRAQILSRKDIAARAKEVKTPTRGFGKTLQNLTADHRIGLIPEIKKASPTLGKVLPDYDPARLAQAYQSAGASCLAVQTEGSCFKGAIEDIERVKNACNLPVLRKDLIVDPWQVYESRLAGADCITLMISLLSDEIAAELASTARGLEMDVLLVVHTPEELQRSLAYETNLLAIDNREIISHEANLDITLHLAPLVPPDRIFVSEGGVTNSDEFNQMGRAGASAVLVGDALFGAQDPGLEARRLLGL